MNRYCIMPLNGLELTCIEFYAFMYEIYINYQKMQYKSNKSILGIGGLV
jgi:hypothetical protein